MSVNFALKCCCLNHTILSRISPWEILVKLYVSQHSSAKTLRFIQCWVRLCVQPFPHTCVHTGRFFFAKLCIVDKIQTHKRLKRMLFIMLFWCPVFGSAGHQKQQKGLTPAIRMLCFAILNSVLFNLLFVLILLKNASSHSCFRFSFIQWQVTVWHFLTV